MFKVHIEIQKSVIMVLLIWAFKRFHVNLALDICAKCHFQTPEVLSFQRIWGPQRQLERMVTTFCWGFVFNSTHNNNNKNDNNNDDNNNMT